MGYQPQHGAETLICEREKVRVSLTVFVSASVYSYNRKSQQENCVSKHTLISFWCLSMMGATLPSLESFVQLYSPSPLWLWWRLSSCGSRYCCYRACFVSDQQNNETTQYMIISPSKTENKLQSVSDSTSSTHLARRKSACMCDVSSLPTPSREEEWCSGN